MLELVDVSKSYGQHRVLEKATIQAPSNGLVLLLGPNGSGKTTLLKLLSGLESPTKGEILFNSKSWGELPASFGKKALYVGDPSFAYDHISVTDCLHSAAMLCAIDQGFQPWEDIFNLPELGQSLCQDLSMGQKQGLNLSLHLAIDATYFLLDEPLISLDAKHRTQFIKAVVKAKKKRTFVVSTHTPDEWMEFSDQVWKIENRDVLTIH